MKKTWLAVLALVLLAFLLRVYRLDFVSLRGDEAFTVVFVQRTWDGLWRGIRFIEPNPPLLYLALRAWVAVAGASEFVTRYFSVFFGVLCVPLLYRLAREVFPTSSFEFPVRRASRELIGTTVAFFAALLIAINPYQVWHSQDVRNYTMWPALSLLALVFFWRWWKLEVGRWTLEVGSWKFDVRSGNLVLYVLATTASLYTHYYDTFVLVALNVFVFAFAGLRRRWATLARWMGAQVTLVLLYAPWVLFGTNRVTTYGEASAQQSVPLLDQFTRTLATFVLSDTVPDALKTILWLPLALALVAIFIYLIRRAPSQAAFLFLGITIPTLALYAISIGRPLFLERYLNGVAPLYYLTFAVGLAAIANYDLRFTFYVLRFTSFVITLLFFGAVAAYALFNNYFDPAYAKAPDWRTLGQVIAARQQPGDVIAQNFNEMSALYYRNGTLPIVTIPKDFWATPDDEKSLEQLNRDYERIWFIPASPDSWDPNNFVERYLARHDELLADDKVGTLRVQLYSTPRAFQSQVTPVNARIGKATLVGYRIENAGEIRSPAALQVRLYWRPLEKIENDLRVFVHLADANDRVVAQQDGVPANGIWPTPDWLPGELIVDTYQLQINAPPGTYSLVVGMYNPATLVRVAATDSTSAPLPNNRVLLTQIAITP
ncbi:MAG: hypothetical protein HY782_18055 [Chloroflexi bacterium]|nr:hypothetical protein [Chloroflexota bacterium]